MKSSLEIWKKITDIYTRKDLRMIVRQSLKLIVHIQFLKNANLREEHLTSETKVNLYCISSFFPNDFYSILHSLREKCHSSSVYAFYSVKESELKTNIQKIYHVLYEKPSAGFRKEYKYCLSRTINKWGKACLKYALSKN